jgi:hypothetical protein
LIILTLTSYSDKYPEPIWYEKDFGDGVIHLWSREIHDDIYGTREQTANEIQAKYENKPIKEIELNIINILYLDSREKRRNKQKELQKTYSYD